MDYQILAVIYATFFVAAFVKGVTGLGFAILSLPIITGYVDLRTAIPLIILPSILGNIMLIVQSGKFTYSVKRFWLLYLSAVPGLYLGIRILTMTEQYFGRIALGIASILYAFIGLMNVKLYISRRTERIATIPVGLANGILNGLTGTHVMPMLPYLFTLNLSKEAFVGAINLSFSISGVALVFIMHSFGYVTAETIKYSLIGVIPVTLGVYAGGKLRHIMSEEKFKTAILILLILIGINLILNPGYRLPA